MEYISVASTFKLFFSRQELEKRRASLPFALLNMVNMGIKLKHYRPKGESIAEICQALRKHL